MKLAWAGGLCLAGWLSAGLPMAARANPERIDPATSRATIVVDMRLAGQVRGRFGQVEGELKPAPGGRWVVQVRLDARGLRLDGPEWRQRSTRSEKFLDVENHPEIRFTSRPFDRELLRTGGELDGDLQLRGRVRPVAFTLAPSACARPGHGCPLKVSGEVSRREFGMAAYRLWVHDAVSFDFQVRLRQPDAP